MRTEPLCGPCRSDCARAERAREILHVVTVLVREHVCLGERSAARAEPGAKLVEEAEVDVHVLVGGAVERPDVGARLSAAGARRAREEDRLRDLVLRQRLRPVPLHAVDDADDPAVLARVRVGARAAVLGEVGRRLRRARRCRRRSTPGSGRRRRRRAARRRRRRRAIGPPGRPMLEPAAAAVLDLRGVEPGVLAKAHDVPCARRASFYALSQEPCVQWPHGRTPHAPQHAPSPRRPRGRRPGRRRARRRRRAGRGRRRHAFAASSRRSRRKGRTTSRTRRSGATSPRAGAASRSRCTRRSSTRRRASRSATPPSTSGTATPAASTRASERARRTARSCAACSARTRTVSPC